MIYLFFSPEIICVFSHFVERRTLYLFCHQLYFYFHILLNAKRLYFYFSPIIFACLHIVLNDDDLNIVCEKEN